MLTRFRSQLSYANVMATIAVFVAVGGTSYAAVTITGANVKNSSLTGSDVKNSSLTGADVKSSSLTASDVKDRSLLAADFKAGQLPAGANGAPGAPGAPGAKGDKGDAGEPANIKRFGVILAVPGETKTLVTYGPFTVTGDCTVNGANLEAGVSIATTEAGSAYAGDDDNEASFGPDTPAADRRFSDAGASSTGPPDISDGYDDQFTAFAPSGSAFTGSFSTWASKNAVQCKFYGTIIGAA